MRPLPPLLEQHFRAPHGARPAPQGALTGRAENAACGDELEVWLELHAQHIDHAGFAARGCSSAIALASLVCERLEGSALGELELHLARWRAEFAALLPPQRRHALDLVERALASALAQARERSHPLLLPRDE
ncbi:MAG: iron-sulfur cluster assembly scaffold protein [Planctomycetes bacterium]|nr:iron-sulfur cluster assembly scaffold protein [Planctomycetota bacterium]